MNSPHLEAAIQHTVGLDPTVNAHDLQVEVVEGRAILTGIVATLAEKEAAGRAASRVAGVRQVENRLTVSANHRVSDRELTRAIETALEALPNNEHRTVGAVVQDGAALLRGHARSAADVEAAHQAVARIPGIKQVIDEVQIDAGASMDEASVRNRLMEALVQSGQVTPYRIEADATGGEVVLKGSVPRPEERERAEEIALAVPGVSRVTNRLQIVELI
jgi:osmotically-inducible protein OsmY